MNTESQSKAEGSSLDIIDTLPQSIIENILCLLPIKEAARTSILSRDWRYKWTTIPKIEFGWSIVSKITKKNQPFDKASARKNMDLTRKHFNAIHQVLLMRQGPIHEFTLTVEGNSNCSDLDQIIFHLSRNHAVKKLKLVFFGGDMYKLPLCAFSLHQLTDLHLTCVDLRHQPMLSGFASLRSLCLDFVEISTKALLQLLANCPLLEWFTLWLVLDSVPGELPTSLLHLKYFCFQEMSFNDKHLLTFLAYLIKCSPNLEKLVLQNDDFHKNEICCGIWDEYSDVWLEHLNELEVKYIQDFKSEMEFLKFILARSPNLKKVLITSVLEKDEQLDMLKILLQAPHASPVEIVVV